MAGARTRSYLADGRCVGWFTAFPGMVAIDAELGDRPAPSALGKRFGTVDFWVRWTRTECAAKLSNTPITLWLNRYGLEVSDDFPGEFRTGRIGNFAVNVVATLAWTWVHSPLPYEAPPARRRC